MASDSTPWAETADLADALYTVMPLVVDHVNARLEEFGMTNTDYWALRSIDGPMPMKDLAHCMEIDPSSVTLVADHLEELGLIERHPHPTDRRVKHLVLTARGRRLKNTIPLTLWDGATTFSALTDVERRRLTALLAKVGAAPHDDGTAGAE